MTTQTTNQNNPLSQFMRMPEIFITLPSGGKFNHPADVELSMSGELGVAAMTTKDDLTLKSPEGLLNGESISSIIQSCCPGIKNVRNLPAPDLDVILLAIRHATYGDDMDFDIKCPNCDHEELYSMSISESLSNMEFLEDEYFVTFANNVKVYVKPFTYELSVKESLQKYHEAQAVKLLVDEDLNLNPEKATEFTKSLHNLADLMTELCSHCIVKILDPEDNQLEATDEQINEWIKFLPRGDAELIQNKIAEINSIGTPKEKTVICAKCEHEWKANVSIDPASFFGISS